MATKLVTKVANLATCVQQSWAKVYKVSLSAAGDPFATEKAAETWQKYEPILRKETVSEIHISLP